MFTTNQKGRIVNMSKWGYSNETDTCDCGIRQTVQHNILVYPMLNTAYSTQDLTMTNGIAIGCARHWEGTILLKCDWWKDKNDDEYNPIRHT